MDETRQQRDPVPRGRDIIADVRHYILHRPQIPTHVQIDAPERRREFEARILLRLGIRADRLTVLNIHRIGIEVPVSRVFDELLTWGDGAQFWPNQLATMVRCGHGLEEMELLLLGRTEMPFGLGDRLFGWPVVPLFRLEALRVQRDPIAEQENARFLLYRCRGGYPIGFIALYARSPIAAMGEREETQLFFTVGFNFYGRKGWSRNRPLRRLWQFIHDRVTGNVLNRIKFLCEARPQGVSP